MLTINIKLAIALLGTGQYCTRTKLQEDKIQQRQNCTEGQFCTKILFHEDKFDVTIDNQKENMLLTEG